MKYKELPAFETNEFKVGDKVKVYNSEGHFTAFVSEIMLNKEFLRLETRTLPVHFKQCRKLEEIKPREFWVDLLENKLLPIEYEKRNKDFSKSGYIKVREVIEDV